MRVVSGEFKGHRLEGPGGAAARPTSDKVREALFSILGGTQDARVLDLFAGTGALAIEALSRGAASATLVERDRRTAKVTEQNLTRILGEEQERWRLVRGDALSFLRSADPAAFELVLIDPPYAESDRLAPLLSELLPSVLAPGARVVCESDRRSPIELAESHFKIRSEHRYGDTLLRILEPYE